MPKKVPHLSVLDYSSRAANLSWTPPYDGQSPITAYTILYKQYQDSWGEAGREQVYGSVTQAVLNGLQPNTVYSIKIEAENIVGVGKASEKQTIKTLEEAPEGAPEDVSVKPISSITVKVIWKVNEIIHYLFSWRRVNLCE